MAKKCDACECHDGCKIFYLTKKNSKAFEEIKSILKLDKGTLYICEEHYPSGAVTDVIVKGKNDKILDKDARDRVPTINMPRSDPPDQISVSEPVPGNEVSQEMSLQSQNQIVNNILVRMTIIIIISY